MGGDPARLTSSLLPLPPEHPFSKVLEQWLVNLAMQSESPGGLIETDCWAPLPEPGITWVWSEAPGLPFLTILR